MTDERAETEELDQPEQIRTDSGERVDGRPTGEPDEKGLLTKNAVESKPTEAPEEQGGEPTTEHAPGASL